MRPSLFQSLTPLVANDAVVFRCTMRADCPVQLQDRRIEKAVVRVCMSLSLA